MDVSIVIINWHSAEYTLACIESIFGKTRKAAFEVIVADNGSFDGLEARARKRFPTVTFMQFNENLGFSRANNRAAREARGRYLLFLNPDTRLESNAVDGMVRFLDAHPRFGAAGPKLVGKDGRIQFACARTFPTPFSQFCQLAMLDRCFPKRPFFSTSELTFWDHTDERAVDCVSGACMMIRRGLFERLDGFDERLFMYSEDIDLCYRIRLAGYRLYYLAYEKVFHAGGGTSEDIPSRDESIAVMQRAASEYFIRKHFGHFKAAAFRGAVGAGAIVRLAAVGASAVAAAVKTPGIASQGRAFGKYGALLLWSAGLRRSGSFV